MNRTRFGVILLATLGILLVPLFAMQFSEEVDWNVGDFAVAGVLLFSFGLLIEWTLRKLKGSKYLSWAIVGIVLILLLIWIELGVGVFGTPFAGS